MDIIVSLIVIIIAIYLLSVITDEFFIGSLKVISTKWNLPATVAGASLMAMGSSAPELFIAISALFTSGGEHSDVGIGTIVGSAVFNILVITGISAVVREARITLTAVLRDISFYLASIAVLLFTFWDGHIVLWETALFLVLYAIYIIVLFRWSGTEEAQLDIAVEREGETDTTGVWAKINGAIVMIFGLIAGDSRKTYIRTFVVSIILIAALSWILVESAIIFAEGLHIPPVIVALTILAGGTSAPDMISSIVVARQGLGGMAIANAVGSNIFDILICLGLPWLIAILFLGRPVIEVGTSDLLLSTFVLAGTVLVLFIFMYTDRILSKREGWILLALYVAYVILTFVSS